MSIERRTPVDTGQSLPPRSDDFLVRALLRFYAKNLRRSWRNTPHEAFVDATMQAEILVAVLLFGFLCMLWVVLSAIVDPSFAQLSQGKNDDLSEQSMIIIVVFSLIVFLFLERKLKPYEFISDVEKKYDTDRDRRIVVWYYVLQLGVIVFSVVGAGIIGRWVRGQ